MTSNQYQLTPDEIASFHENGFVGPFPMCTPEEMAEIRTTMREVLHSQNKIYGFDKAVGRDRHLDTPAVYDIVKHPAATERIAQLLGPDLMVWRSTFFLKPPGAPEIVWHAASIFEEFTDNPILEPPDVNGFFQITTWLAIDEVTLANSPIQLAAGTHRTMRPQGRSDKTRDRRQACDRFGTDQKGFVGYDMDDDFEIDQSKVHTMLCKPGEFFIFDQRTVHRSPPNNSPNRRLAFAFRTIRADVKAYGQFLPQGRIEHYGETWDLAKWGCVLTHGRDPYHLNKMAEPPRAAS